MAAVPLIALLFLLMAARKHPWLSQNLTNQEVNISSTLELACSARGVPQPHISWNKNSVPLKEGPGNSRIPRWLWCNSAFYATFV